MGDWYPTTYGDRNSTAAAAIGHVWEDACGKPFTQETWEQFQHDAARAALEVADNWTGGTDA